MKNGTRQTKRELRAELMRKIGEKSETTIHQEHRDKLECSCGHTAMDHYGANGYEQCNRDGCSCSWLSVDTEVWEGKQPGVAA